MPEQSFENHAKMVPLYHYVTTALLIFALVVFGEALVSDRSLISAGGVALVIATISGTLYGRIFALGVQDRVIRLEERLRLARVLPADLHDRIEEISTSDLVGLRFASDEELPELTRRVLEGEFENRKAIKAAIRNWRADHERV